MRKIAGFGKIGMALALAGMVAMGTPAAARSPRPTGEEQLAKLLKDRVPGKPVDCINMVQTRSSTIIDKTAIVYDAGSVLYVNRPSGHESLNSDDVLVTKTWSSQLCRLDIVQLHDRAGMWWRGSVGLESFTPYTRPPRNAPQPAVSPAAQATPAPPSGG